MNKFLFPHMPKTGGTSILHALNSCPELHISECYASPLKAKKSILKRLRNKVVCSRLSASEEFLYGHFSLNDVPSERLTNSRTIMFFREPIDWIGSYLFYFEKKHAARISNIERFIASQNLERCYELFLGTYTPSDLDFIGIFEQYDLSVARLSRLLKVDLPIAHKNVTERPQLPYRKLLSARFDLTSIVRAMDHNLQIYNEALSLFQNGGVIKNDNVT